MAERNLEGCYQKRLLEAARFMWMDGLKQMMQELGQMPQRPVAAATRWMGLGRQLRRYLDQ